MPGRGRGAGISVDVLAHRIQENQRDIIDLRQTIQRQSSFHRWIVGIIVTVGLAITGIAYAAHSKLADRLIEVGNLTNGQLARIEERLSAVRDRLTKAEETGAPSAPACGAGRR